VLGRAAPVDIAVCAAAVGDWRVKTPLAHKIKKSDGEKGAEGPQLSFTENPDILRAIAGAGAKRPRLVVGFAAETANLIDNAKAKLADKGCDWIVANDVGAGAEVFGAEENTGHLVTEDGVEAWPKMTKTDLARRLAERIADALGRQDKKGAVRRLDEVRPKKRSG
ncbi:MAG: hypothetical protein O7C63_02740, partial [Alphaproteobacteria bacterium]|nr:hypothetical protein [Alphaproteobacteria bacterium]